MNTFLSMLSRVWTTSDISSLRCIESKELLDPGLVVQFKEKSNYTKSAGDLRFS